MQGKRKLAESISVILQIILSVLSQELFSPTISFFFKKTGLPLHSGCSDSGMESSSKSLKEKLAPCSVTSEETCQSEGTLRLARAVKDMR